MAIFKQGNDLNTELDKLVDRADNFLYIVSPYVKMHQRFKDELKHKLERPELEIVFLFGKNGDDLSKSFDKDDITFLKTFPNITIAHKKELHAKFYASEDAAIITSLNLYSFSQNNNIEAGVVLYPPNTLNKITNSIMQSGEEDAYNDSVDYFRKVIKTSEILFKKTPEYESQYLGFKQKYSGSKLEIDNLDALFNSVAKPQQEKKVYVQKTDSKPAGNNHGYCIRTGAEIPFNVERPMSYAAYQSWAKFSDPNYKEKYCHFSGEISNGETSFNKPILKKNWEKAKSVHGVK